MTVTCLLLGNQILNNTLSNRQIKGSFLQQGLELLPGVVACTCSPGTLEAECRNSVGLISVWMDCATTSNPAQGKGT